MLTNIYHGVSMSLIEFDVKLKSLLKDIENPRPLVCDGNPLSCEIFIVGFNAATEMKAPFWDFWSTKNGFDKNKWFETYVKERAEKPLKPGKTRRNKVSNTRQRIEWILETLPNQISCLETNIYMSATTEASELNASLKDASTFNFLIREIEPKLVLVHGLDAIKHIEKILNCSLELGMENKTKLNEKEIIIYPIKHLSRGWSKQSCSGLGSSLGSLL